MKRTALFVFLLISFSATAQNTAFKMPSEIKFERTVVQKYSGKKTGMLSYYFTTNGDYAALKPDSREGALIIYTKEGNMLIVSDKEKSIIVMNMKAFLNKAKEMASNRSGSKDTAASKTSFKKTGNTKTIAGYPAEEYEITTEKGKMNTWYVKVDFDSALALSLGAAKGPGSKSPFPGEDFENIPGMGKNLFMAEMQKDGKTVLETINIDKSGFTFSPSGYTVRDMSDMMKGNYQ